MLAQLSLTPNATPTNTCEFSSCWISWMAIGGIVLGAIILLLAGVSYLRFAPRFSRDEDESAPRAGRRAPEVPVRLSTNWPTAPPPGEVAPVPVPPPTVAAPQPAAVAVAVAAPAASAAAATATAPAPAAAPSEVAPAEPAAPPEGAGTPQAEAPAAAPAAPRVEVELDQETFDRVLQEELGKGTQRRVAEGKARRAALIAARKKAEG